MDKEPTVPKWVLTNQPKIPQMPKKFLVKFVCPSTKVWNFQKKKSSLWVSAVHGQDNSYLINFEFCFKGLILRVT